LCESPAEVLLIEHGSSILAPGGSFALSTHESAISVQPLGACKTGNIVAYDMYTNRQYDTRLSGMEDVILGNVNGIIYIAGWKGSYYEVWSMAHSESLTTKLSADGGVAPRNLTFVGSFPNTDRGTFEFQPNGTQMLVKGYDKVAKKQRVWKI
jgi:hypothetical protein